jgi:predicted dehydrogenase
MQVMKKLNRRDFIKTAGVAGATALMGPSLNVWGANDEIRVAVFGVRSQGFENAKQFAQVPGVKVVAFAEPDRKILDKRIKDWADVQGGAKIDGHIDFREVLDRDDVDAINIASPNHWHSLQAIMACQAGKDVYVQKPVSHNIWEGRQLVKAAHKYKRIVQTGTQNRSDIGLVKMYPWLFEGNIGKVTAVRGLCYRNRTGIGKLDKPLTPPDSVNYDLWLGPAKDQPIYRPNLHYDWHWDFNTGNGDIGNQGPHEMDMMRWALGDESLPTRVVSFGGRFAWDDGGNTPNMQYAAYDFNGIPAIFEVRNVRIKPGVNAMPHYMGCRVGVIITCEGGYFVGGRGGGKIYDNDGKEMKQFKGDGGGAHQANFIDAMRSRKESILRAPIEKGHLSASLMHMANVSYKLGKDMDSSELQEHMQDDKEALDAIERYSAHLAEWDVNFRTSPWTGGVSLGFNPGAERFTGYSKLSRAANKLLKRDYREPWVVPKNV